MFYMKDYQGNALDITDQEVSSDWRLGVLRGAAKVVQQRALPLDSTEKWGRAAPGSNREHILGRSMFSADGIAAACPIAEVYNVKEERGEIYHSSTFNSSTEEVIILKANATCSCGKMTNHPVQLEISPGDLIYEVTNS